MNTWNLVTVFPFNLGLYSLSIYSLPFFFSIILCYTFLWLWLNSFLTIQNISEIFYSFVWLLCRVPCFFIRGVLKQQEPSVFCFLFIPIPFSLFCFLSPLWTLSSATSYSSVQSLILCMSCSFTLFSFSRSACAISKFWKGGKEKERKCNEINKQHNSLHDPSWVQSSFLSKIFKIFMSHLN